MQLIDAQCRTEQVQAVLSVWLESNPADEGELALVCALLNLMHGVPEAIRDHINSQPIEGAK
ncbi:hypothetical protein ABQ397_24255 [Serratia fonticola]|uniref:hypothetical protein n=1 Tax=Serratia fonticola TaxID=47917 RepID=UPI003AAC2BAB